MLQKAQNLFDFLTPSLQAGKLRIPKVKNLKNRLPDGLRRVLVVEILQIVQLNLQLLELIGKVVVLLKETQSESSII